MNRLFLVAMIAAVALILAGCGEQKHSSQAEDAASKPEQRPVMPVKQPKPQPTRTDADAVRFIRTFSGCQFIISQIAFSPDNRMLAFACSARTVTLWDATSGKVARSLKGRSTVYHSVAFSNDGKMLAASSRDQDVDMG